MERDRLCQEGHALKILGLFEALPPERCDAAGRTALDLMKLLSWRHQVIASPLAGAPDLTAYGPVGHATPEALELLRDFPDVVLAAPSRAAEADRIGKPSVFLIHHEQSAKLLNSKGVTLGVFASDWLRRRVPWDGPTHALGPLVSRRIWRTCAHGDLGCPCNGGDLCRYEYPERHARPSPPIRRALTLINLRPDKGAGTVYALAQRMPEREFLAVIGATGAQLPPPLLAANVELVEHTADLRSVYARTRILLLPSSYEGGSRVIQEAACSGIPTIASPLQAFAELGEPAVYRASRERAAEWDEAVHALDDEKTYARASEAARAVARSFDPVRSAREFETALEAALARRRAA